MSAPSVHVSARTLSTFLVLPLLAGLAFTSSAQSAKQVITLEKPSASQASAEAISSTGNPLAKLHPNFRSFGTARAGEATSVQVLTLHFAATDKLTKITSSKDFTVESGGSCVEGDVYPADGMCTLLVRFTPKGGGHRLGRLTIADTASAAPMSIGLGGEGFAPVVSFTPSQITTVPGTDPGGTGLMMGAFNLAVDGSDSLYIADTGHNLIRYLDSSGAFVTISGEAGPSAPTGIAVDNFGDVFFSEPAAGDVKFIYNFGSAGIANGSGTDTCTPSSPCPLSSEAISSPGAMSMDANDNLFLSDAVSGADEVTGLQGEFFVARLTDEFTYQSSPNYAFAVDSQDNLYSYWHTEFSCILLSQGFYNAAAGNEVWKKIAGGRACGYSGDGGQAGNAEIGTEVGQTVFDLAGNLYFSDTVNNRVRRIDASTGIIRTIAGNGVAGYTGDGGRATTATLNAPTGVGVDSQGQVYIISYSSTSKVHQVVRLVGTAGDLVFPNTLEGTHSAPLIVNVANTGNDTLVINSAVFTGAYASDFAIDPGTTSCALTSGSALAAGHSCQIGVIFTPASASVKTASLTILDNTVNNSNTVLLSGAGTAPAATVKIAAPADESSYSSGTAIPFTVGVSSAKGAAPTGTVSFKVDGAAFGSPVAIASSAATIKVTGLTTKTHTLSATYNGDANYAPSSVSESVVVIAATAKPLQGWESLQ